MLEYLRIQNLALIADMELEFVQGMNVVTGETGAGKSFILKAINFLMGDKINVDIIRQGKNRAQVEALFVHSEEGEIILRRELSSTTGRSRFYVNDMLSSAESIKRFRHKLITYTSQHGQQKLLQQSFQEQIIDIWVCQPELFKCKIQLIEKINACLSKKKMLITRLQELEGKRDMFNMYLEEINKVNPKPQEDEQLEAVKERFKLINTIQKDYTKAFEVLFDSEDSLYAKLSVLRKHIENIVSSDNTFFEYAEVIVKFSHKIYELKQVLQKKPSVLGETRFDIDAVEERLFTLSQLKRKLHRSLPEIFILKEEVERNLSFLDICTLDICQVDKEYNQLLEELKNLLVIINESRYIAAQIFCSAIKLELVELGFSEHIEIIVDFFENILFPDCIEKKPRLFWAPNPGHPPHSLEHIISGGELSRFLLALISIQTKGEEGVLVFDEIDAGIGGQTLKVVAHKLAKISEQRQLLVVTHWPQLAVKANRHFQVVKDIQDNITYTRCKQLSSNERKEELSRMACV